MQKNPPRVVLVTGAARRIGAEIARTLHAAGMNVVLHYHISVAEAKALSNELNEKRSHSAVAIQADLSTAGSEQTLVEAAVQTWGRLDVLVNNASRFYRTSMGEVTEQIFADLMTSNLKAPFFLAQAAVPALSAAQGCIVNIADIHGEWPLKYYAIYCMAKGGLLMMTRVLAKELGPRIRVNAVSPGAVMWPEGENALSEEDKQKIIGEGVLKREGSASDIAKAVLYFVRDADYVSGQVLRVDGGRLLM